jgi:hypothetical protein
MLLDQTNSYCRTTHFRIIAAILEEQTLDQNNIFSISPVQPTGVFILARAHKPGSIYPGGIL